MAALTGSTVASTYKDLLQVSNSNSGIDATLRAVSDGEGTASILKLNTTDVAVATDSGQLKLGASTDVGIKRDAASTLEITDGSTGYGLLQASAISLVNSLGWSSTADPAGGRDVAIERAAAGVAKISDASTGAGTLTCGGFQTGAYTAVADGKGIFNATLNDATGDEVALTLNYTTNKATSGNDTGLQIVQTDTASPGTSYLIDAKVGSTSKFSINNGGYIVVNPQLTTDANTVKAAGAIDWNNRMHAGYTTGVLLASGGSYSWTSDATNWYSGSADSGFARAAAGVVKVTDGSTGYGALSLDTNSAQYADTVTITDDSATAIVDVAVAAGAMAGGRLIYTITATDATDHQAKSGSVTFSAVNKAGTTTCTIAEDITPVDAFSTGTLTDTWTIADATNKVTISLQANTSLTPTAMTCRYQLFLNHSGAVTKKT